MFNSRQQAGDLLATQLSRYRDKSNVVVLAIPRGGVAVGRVVADALHAPLDVVVTRKIPSPHQPELALGAVGSGGIRVIDVSLVQRLGVEEGYLVNTVSRLQQEVAERERKFRGKKKAYHLHGKVVVIADDGIATGATVEAAIRFIKTKKPTKIVLAVPVASKDSVEMLSELVDEVVVLLTPQEFFAVGQFYREFQQVTDEEVVELLRSDVVKHDT